MGRSVEDIKYSVDSDITVVVAVSAVDFVFVEDIAIVTEVVEVSFAVSCDIAVVIALAETPFENRKVPPITELSIPPVIEGEAVDDETVEVI
ncbi:hypothetical protein HDU82_008042 [Entophlyctis luteolus]|nr:hypothetical protein HDU82_008042 [Entophlyctis luteolus]